MRTPESPLPSISLVLSQLCPRPSLPCITPPSSPTLRRVQSSPTLVLRKRSLFSSSQCRPPRPPPQFDCGHLMSTVHRQPATDPCRRPPSRSSCALSMSFLDETETMHISIEPPSPTDSVSFSASDSSSSGSSTYTSAGTESTASTSSSATRRRARIKAILREAFDVVLFRWWGAPHPVRRTESMLTFDICTAETIAIS